MGELAMRGHGLSLSGRPLFLAAVAVSLAALVPSTASADVTIDLKYDSVMDMVRPEQRSGIVVHHNLEILFTGQTAVENRDRNTKNLQDRNAMDQDLGGEDPAVYASWRVLSKTRLVRTQRDPQSTRTMTVTLAPDGTCHLDVVDKLSPGFTEYAFRRIASHAIGYFSSYRVLQTTCSIRK